MHVLYTIFYAVCFAVLLPAGLYVLLRRSECRARFAQRFGVYSAEVRRALDREAAGRCWIHAVSAGEVNVALSFVGELKKRVPALDVVLTTTTPEGYELAARRRPEDVVLLYFAFDFPSCVRRSYRWIRPDFVVLVELELWPNHLRVAFEENVPVFLVNGRMPPEEARGYRRWRGLFEDLFSRLHLVCAQEKEDAEKFEELGVAADRVQTTGNMKFDASLPQREAPAEAGPEVKALLRQIGVSASQPVLVAGSTHPGEEEILFGLVGELRREFPGLFLILVPRHVHRAFRIAALARRSGISVLLRSDVTDRAAPTGRRYDCLLVDSVGELPAFYRAATAIYVGKSLVAQGGQNIVEAAASGRPVIFGPHMHNFRTVARQFVAHEAAMQVRDAGELRHALRQVLGDPALRGSISAAARQVIQANRGATERTVDLVVQALKTECGTFDMKDESTPFRVMMVAGEVSGDRQAAFLCRAIRARNEAVTFFGVGGEEMARAGVDVRMRTSHMGCVGFQEAVRFLILLRGVYKTLMEMVRSERPDVAVLVDNEGFNTALAGALRREGVPVVFYFAPQVWLWGECRARSIARRADLILAVFQDEAEIYERAGARVVWMGHPVVDMVKSVGDRDAAFRKVGLDPSRPTLAILPGSRFHELRRLTPIMAAAAHEVAARHPDLQMVLPLAAPLWREMIEGELGRGRIRDRVTIVTEDIYSLLSGCRAAMVKAGTSTLEAALLGVPMVVAYQVSAFSYSLGRWLLKTPFIAMPNILAGEEIVPEFRQRQVTPERLAREVLRILEDEQYAEAMRGRYHKLRAALGPDGVTERAAALILEEASRGRRARGA